MTRDPALGQRRRDRRSLFASMIAVSLASSSCGVFASTEDSVRRRLRLTLTFHNAFGHALQNQSFWCYLPASIGGGQRLVSVDVSGEHELSDDQLGHRILHLKFEQFPAYANKVVTVTAEVALGAAISSQPLDAPATWLAAERFIESDDTRVRHLASTLKRSSETGTARAIYDWVRTNMTYTGYIPDELGALSALTARGGDCTEYADLSVALARANGIPARMVGGFVIDRDSTLRSHDYHNWAELHLDGAWRIVDAQKEAWIERAGRYVIFRIHRDTATNAVGPAHRYLIHGDITVDY